MKTFQILLAAAFAGLFHSGCSHEYVSTDDNTEDYQVRFVADRMIATRTTDDGESWVEGDSVGVFMIVSGESWTKEEDALFYNVPYVINDASTRELAPAVGTSPIYYPMSGTVDIIVYYPFDGSISDNTYMINIANQADPAKIDVLYFKKTNVERSKDDPVELIFSHVLSKITLEVNFSGGSSEDVIEEVSFTGMPQTATLDLQDGTVTADGEGDEGDNFTANNEGVNKFAAILIPHSSSESGHKAVFTVNAQTSYTWNIPDTETFEPGKNHTYSVTINNE